jgi:hypothetical protein
MNFTASYIGTLHLFTGKNTWALVADRCEFEFFLGYAGFKILKNFFHVYNPQLSHI